MSEVRELPLRKEAVSEVRELIDAELDAVCGGHHGHHGHHEHHEHHEHHGHFDFGNYGNIGSFGNNTGNSGNSGNSNFGDIVNFGNIVIEQNIALQIGVAVGDNASVTNLLGGQTNLSSIFSDALDHLLAPQALSRPLYA